jgi:hypothetical protein
MISVVNGYICTTSCEVAAAKQGKDPAAPPGSVPGTSNQMTSGLDTRSATLLECAPKDFASANTATGTDASQAAIAQHKVDRLA